MSKRPYTGYLRLSELHPVQQKVWDDNTRHRVLVAGRRFGKSRLALQIAIHCAVNLGQNVWYMAPNFTTLSPMWRQAKTITEGIYKDKNENQKFIAFNPRKGSAIGGVLSFRSGDSGDSLRGSGLDLVVMDEAAFMDEYLWENVIQPSLMDRKGRLLSISTPKGKASWFYQAYLRGKNPDEKDWKSWQFPSSENPFIDPDEIESLSNSMTQINFQQEILAEFTDDDAGVFRGVRYVANAKRMEGPRPHYSYIAGIDWGRHNDFTVFSIFEAETQTQAEIVRFTDIGYEIQVDRVVSTAKKWGLTTIYVEANSMGAPLVETLMARGLPVVPVYFTNPTKTDLVERLSLNIERRHIHLLDYESLLGELQAGELNAYTMKRTKSGLFTYEASKGFHDDCVVATMLANKHFNSSVNNTLSIVENIFYPSSKRLDAPTSEPAPVELSKDLKRLWHKTYTNWIKSGRGPIKSKMKANQAVKEVLDARSN